MRNKKFKVKGITFALPRMEQALLFPFPTLTMKDKRYKIFGLVTNREVEGEELIHWYWQRCGKSEEAHGVMKNDFQEANCHQVHLVRMRPGGGV
jgi:hypothetical protein